MGVPPLAALLSRHYAMAGVSSTIAEKSIQLESLASHKRAEILPLGHGVLARLVLRPAIKRGLAEPFHLTPLAFRNRETGVAATIVAVDLGDEIRVVVAVDMHAQRHRHAHADEAFARRPADTKPGE